MTDGLSLRERVERHREQHPTASAVQIAGALGAPPSAVADVLDENTGDDPPQLSEDAGDRVRRSRERSRIGAEWGRWNGADWADPEADVYPPALLDREQWMGHQEKKPFAPWADRDAPAECSEDGHDTAATCDCDARYKWGYEGNYLDGEGIAMAEVDPRLDGRAFLQQPEDPFAYVDGDDVRNPETGDVHPAFVAILEHLGLTYADVSQSGSGAHAIYRGELPEGVKEASWQLDEDPWGGNDDLPSVEIYARKRVCVMTGDHVDGTPTEVREWDDDALETIVRVNDDVAASQQERVEDVDAARESFDSTDYEPAATSADETTTDIRDIFAAIDRLDARDVADRTIVHRWNDSASTSDGERAFAPTWGKSSNGTANIVNDKRWMDTGDRGGYGGPVVMAAIDAGELDERHAAGGVSGETWWRGVEHLRDLGFSIPELEEPDDYDAEQTSGGISEHWPIEECEPPSLDRETVTPEDRWGELQGERFEQFVDADGPVAWADDPGNGKTTNAAIGAEKRERPHAVLFDKHQKAREFIEDDPTADDYYHLKGGAQKRGAVCMDVDHDDDQEMCPEHGHVADCPHMCPIYDFATDHEGRKRYEALAGEVGPVKAHQILADELPGHDEHGHCAWLDQFDELSSKDRVVGVHQYQLLKTVQQKGSDGPQRDILIDESPDSLRSDRRVTVEDLARAGNALEGMVSNAGDDNQDALGEFARFARDLVDAITDPDAPDTLVDLEAPAVEGETITREVDPEDLPDDVDEADVETKTVREHQGMPGEGYTEVEKAVVEEPMVEETLAQCKLHYNETLIARMRDDRWSGTPLVFDALLAAAAAAGLDDESARTAIAVATTLDHCPWCGEDVGFENGARHCESAACDWHEADHNITRRDGPTARACAELDLEPEEAGDPQGVFYEELPQPSSLPDSPLILDATTTKRKIAGLYRTPVDDVLVTGDEPQSFENLRATQVLDGQYHAGTIDDSESLQERIQRVIDTAADVHQSPLYVVKRGLQPHFEFPDDSPVLHYHAARGLNYNDCDAVVAIGAPHPRVDDLEREAELLAMDHPDLRVGGVEHSTRADTEDPVYRKLHFEDGDGTGRAVPTKHFSGLTGDLFEESRSKELTQVIHRTRPVLADETKHAYLLTNVPTDVPVDEVSSFDELADPIEAMLPVPEGAVDLLEAVDDVVHGEGPDGFRADRLVDERDDGTIANRVEGYHRLAQLAGLDVSQRTVYNWVHALEDIGLLQPESYEQHAGVAYTADAATLKSALSVLSSNGSFKVAAKRRLRSLLAESESGLDWLAWAKRVFELRGTESGAVSPGGGAPGA
ncbi:hypothetical protein [Haloarcula montana]|uniref:hypothetical protein n=1 Tax=Haloarcula montana TaxID=3111776 RepID=UPI002D76E67E|nr:hypothetical protein [Haloarcula sp. GH36]